MKTIRLIALVIIFALLVPNLAGSTIGMGIAAIILATLIVVEIESLLRNK